MKIFNKKFAAQNTQMKKIKLIV